MLSVLAFLITIGVLVVVHEYGHYLFARLFNVKILTFSVGFGPKLLSFQGKSNEWRLSLIPFGGYVRMLDEREGNVNPEEKKFAFNNKPPVQKILIALAGPLFNILFAILLYYIIGLIGISQLKPVISSINPKMLQQFSSTSLVSPVRILTINGLHPDSWQDAERAFNNSVLTSSEVNFQLQRLDEVKSQLTVTLPTLQLRQHFKKDIYLENLGLYPVEYLPSIAYIEPHSVADKAGLKTDDTLLMINSVKIKSWFQVTEIIRSSPGVMLQLIISRHGNKLKYNVVPSTSKEDGQLIGKLGIMPALNQELLLQNSFIRKYDWFSSMGYAINECYSVTKLNIVSIYQLISGKMSLYNLGGPITIAKVGGSAIHDGFIHFAAFLALISIGLAIMNLLPIPVLDGGHIIVYLAELVTRRRLPVSVQEFIFKIGFILVLGLSLFAIYNDMMRL